MDNAAPTPRPRPLRTWWLRVACASCLLVAATLALALALGGVRPAYGTVSGQLSVGDQILYAGWGTNAFTVNGNEAYCGEPGQATPAEGTYAMEPTDDGAVRAILWWGYGGPGFDAAAWPATYYDGRPMDAGAYRVSTHVALAFLRTGSVSYACENASASFTSWCERNVLGYSEDGSLLNESAPCCRIRQGAIEVPVGFTAYSFSTGSSTQIMYTYTYVPHGQASLAKASANPAVSQGNPCYSLAGARYGAYRDAACTDLVATFVTDASGATAAQTIPSGRYYVKELSAPPGFALDATVHALDVPVRSATTLRLEDAPQCNPVELCLQKLDRETGQSAPQGAATLAGAQYAARFFGGLHGSAQEAEASGEPLASWLVETDAEGRACLDEAHVVSGDKLFRDSRGRICLPLGTLVLVEQAPPAGYLLDAEPLMARIEPEGSAEAVSTFAAPDHPEQVIRGDLGLVKAREADQRRLAGVPFLVTSLSTGEAHLLVTDENGEARTNAAFNPHTCAPNANDAALGRDGAVDESALDPRAGIWFGQSAPDDGHGALPYDSYRIEELRCSANEGLELVTLPCVTISREAYEVGIGTIDDQSLASMRLNTTARDDSDGDKAAAPQAGVTIVDHVEYHGVCVGTSYLIDATLMARSTLEPVVDAEGGPITSQVPFVAEAADGTLEVPFELDATSYEGEDLVIFVDLVDAESGLIAATDRDPDNYQETIHVEEMPPEEPAAPEEVHLAQTGDRALAALGALALGTAATLGALAWRRRRSRQVQRERARSLLDGMARR